MLFAPQTTKAICPRCAGTGRELDHKAVGKAMRERRRKLQVELEEIAQLMGISRSYLLKLEYGQWDWRTHLLEAYERALLEVMRQRSLAR